MEEMIKDLIDKLMEQRNELLSFLNKPMEQVHGQISYNNTNQINEHVAIIDTRIDELLKKLK